MTEAEWLTCTDVLTLLEELPTRSMRRRRRLFSIACCRQLGRWISNERLWKCLDASERYADGKLKDSGLAHWTAEVNKSWDAVRQSPKTIRNKTAVTIAHHAIAYTCLAERYAASGSAARIILGSGKTFGKPFIEDMRSLFLHLFRDVFGNPFHRFRMDPAWRTRAVVGIAEAIYHDRGFEEMPILADALEEAECTEGELLAHCRQSGPHVRGCWVLDLLLGKIEPLPTAEKNP